MYIYACVYIYIYIFDGMVVYLFIKIFPQVRLLARRRHHAAPVRQYQILYENASAQNIFESIH